MELLNGSMSNIRSSRALRGYSIAGRRGHKKDIGLSVSEGIRAGLGRYYGV